jgi:uncharacterized membrane protein YhiD involved in acid resistance
MIRILGYKPGGEIGYKRKNRKKTAGLMTDSIVAECRMLVNPISNTGTSRSAAIFCLNATIVGCPTIHPAANEFLC